MYTLSINQFHKPSVERDVNVYRSITVVKEKQKKPRFSFVFVYSYRESLHMELFGLSSKLKAETQIMRPVCEAGYWIKYRRYVTTYYT